MSNENEPDETRMLQRVLDGLRKDEPCYNAQKLHKELFGNYASDEHGLEEIRKFLELHDLELAHALAEQQRKHIATTQYTDVFRTIALVLTDKIDPLVKLLEEHDWDETIFGGFICMKCTPEDPGFDDVVAWPCPPLKAAGLTDVKAVEMVEAHWAKIDEEHKAKQEKA